MPKKTKKEKILAAYRKKLRSLEQNNNRYSGKRPSENREVRPESRNDSGTASVLATQNDPLPKYFFLDLRKSFILITFIIALEISLYFAKLIK